MYKPFDKIVCRFPYYSVEVMNKALSEEEYFKNIVNSDAFKEAIFFASPVLYEELTKYIKDGLKDKDKKSLKNSLVRYLSRMSTRCTPFALFASCAVGTINDETEIKLSDNFDTFVRFDMLYLCNLAQKIEKMEDIKKNIQYYPNTTIYFKTDKVRYIEYRFGIQSRSYQLVEITKTPYLVMVINEARKGSCIEELINILVDKYEVDHEMATTYIDQIIESQILVSEIDPIITGPDFFGHIISVIERLDKGSEIYSTLDTLKDLLSQLNSGTANAIEVCNKIEDEIKKMDVPYQKKFLLQVDSLRQMEKAYLGNGVVKVLQDYMEFLNKITPRYENPLLNSFKQSFMERYEEQEIPLLEALDPELGIGYPSNQVNDMDPLLAGLVLPNQQGNGIPQYRLTPLYLILQKKLMNFNPAVDDVIRIDEEDVKHLATNWNDLPGTLAVMFRLIGKGSDPDNYMLQGGGFNGGAANLLGRFAYCSTGVSELVSDITREEKGIYSDYIVAEISHIPDSRVGNILARPYFRDYEIVYLANSIRQDNSVIYPSDIMLSIRNGKIMLRSKSLNRYILPRLSTAHNYSNNPTPVYRFLCELQSQGERAGLYFTWGELDQQLDYLPRVCYKNIICSLAKWKLQVKDLKSLMKQNDDNKLLQEIKLWKDKFKLPRYVDLADGDNKLFIDLENINSIHTFISVLSNRNMIVLEEFIEDEYSIAEDMNGEHYTNECIVSFYKSEEKQK